jgi:polyhydroxyalkanoate synthesis repressor PhaR
LPVIKRYSNRKLYNTTTRRYITLEEIADLISEGEDVRVVDHASGNDLTTLTLAQVLFELEKKPGGLFPGVMFEKIIKSGQSNLQAYRKAIQALVNPKLMIDNEIIHRLDVLIDSGKISQEEYEYWKILLVEKLPEEPVSANLNSSEMINQIEAKITDLEEELTLLQNHASSKAGENLIEDKG